MKQILLPVVEQFTSETDHEYIFVGNTNRVGTIIITDSHQPHKNRCEIYGVPTRIERNKIACYDWINNKSTDLNKLSVMLKLFILKVLPSNDNSLILTKYCALIFDNHYLIDHGSTIENKAIRISSNSDKTISSVIQGYYIDIKNIVTNEEEIKGLLMEHSI